MQSPRAAPARHTTLETHGVARAPTPTPKPDVSNLSGHVQLQGGRGQDVGAADLTHTLVYYVPAKGLERARPGKFNVYTHDRDFNPGAIAVPVGSVINFVNLDDVRHNVFSVTPGSAFNLGYQGHGESIEHRFDHPGLVLVSCNVHRMMHLDIMVVPSRWSTHVGGDGRFTLRNLPPGPGSLHIWNPRAQPLVTTLKLPDSAAINERLLLIKPPVTTALNLDGTQ